MDSILTADTERKDEFRRHFLMIKYPRHVLGIPSEKLFKLDTNNMVKVTINYRVRQQRDVIKFN